MISIFLVMCVLPQILLMGDIIIKKTSFSIDRSSRVSHQVGLMRIDGRVRGSINGLIDAEVHGLFRGTLNAIIEIGGVQPMEEQSLEEHISGEEKAE